MSPIGDGFLSRDDQVLADRLDQRIDALAGYELKNFAAGANLKMSADVGRLQAWRRDRSPAWGLTGAVAVAAARALEQQPLFAAQFDGRDRLEISERPSLGIGLDTGDHARVEVIPEAIGLSGDALARQVREAAAAVQVTPQTFSFQPSRPVSAWRNRRRWLRMASQEISERFDYLVPWLQARRFDREAAARGHFQIHNLGAGAVQEFKGFLRRPAVACLWVLAAEQRVVPDGGGGFAEQLRLPLVLVYAQELIPLDRACGFLGQIVSALEQPDSLAALNPGSRPVEVAGGPA